VSLLLKEEKYVNMITTLSYVCPSAFEQTDGFSRNLA
jgi:hypothetical protein